MELIPCHGESFLFWVQMRIVDSKKNIPMQIWGERGEFIHILLVSLVFYATFGCNCLLFYGDYWNQCIIFYAIFGCNCLLFYWNYWNQYLLMGVATTTCKEKNGTQVDKRVPFSTWILYRKIYTLTTRGFFRFLQFCPVGGLLIHPQEEWAKFE